MRRVLLIALVMALVITSTAQTKMALKDQTKPPGTNGQLLYNNNGVTDAEDPIVSYNYAQLIAAQLATGTVTGSAVRLSTFSGFGTLYVTFASITGSPSGCTLQLKNYDSAGNSINNGSAVAVSPANGTTTVAIASGANLQTAGQMSATYACGVYPSAGTVTVEFVPGLSVGMLAAMPQNANAAPYFVRNTDGTNNAPAMDAAARKGFVAVTDGSNTAAVKPASTAAAATDPAVVVSVSPNSVAPVAGSSASGAADSGNPVKTGGVFNSALPTASAGQRVDDQSDPHGRKLVVAQNDTLATSYHASVKFAASSTTDNAVMPGNATNTVLLTRIQVTCTQTTAGQINVEILKRSTADSSGTAANMTVIPDDANYAAGVSVPKSYTGTGPTVGTPIGDLDNAWIGCMAPGTATPNDVYIFKPAKPIVLRGTAQMVAVNVGNAALTGGSLTVTYEWIETTTP